MAARNGGKPSRTLQVLIDIREELKSHGLELKSHGRRLDGLQRSVDQLGVRLDNILLGPMGEQVRQHEKRLRRVEKRLALKTSDDE